jgi:hypothetical protein
MEKRVLIARWLAHLFPSTPFVLGTGVFSKQKLRLETATVEPGSVLVMFTDGLKSRTSLKGKLDILHQPAIAIAQHLIENHSRPDDDALGNGGAFPIGVFVAAAGIPQAAVTFCSGGDMHLLSAVNSTKRPRS